MGSEGRRETLIIVNPAAHNVPSRKRLDEADGWLRSQGWRGGRGEEGGARQGGGGGGGGGAAGAAAAVRRRRRRHAERGGERPSGQRDGAGAYPGGHHQHLGEGVAFPPQARAGGEGGGGGRPPPHRPGARRGPLLPAHGRLRPGGGG